MVWTVKVWSDLPDAGQVVLAKVDDTSGRSRRPGRARRSPGRWRAATTAPSAARSTTRGSGAASASSSSSASPTSASRSRCATSTCSSSSRSGSRSTSSTAARSSRRCRLPTRRCSTSSAAWPGSAGRAAGARRAPLWPVWVLLAATVFLAGFRFGMNLRASNVIDVGLAGVIGAQRIVEDGEARTGTCRTTRERSAASPTRTATSASGSRRTGAARWRTGAATRTGPVSYLAYVPGLPGHGLRLRMGLPARRPLHVAPLGRARPDRAWGCSASASGAAPRGDARLRVGRLPLHAVRLELELERRDHAGVPDLGARLRHLGAGARPLRRRWPRGRSSPRCSSLPLWASYPKAAKWPRQQLLFAGGLLLATALGVLDPPARARPAPRCPRLLGSDVRLAALTAVALLDLGLERVPGLPRPPGPADGAEGPPGRRRRGAGASSPARATSSSSPPSPARC